MKKITFLIMILIALSTLSSLRFEKIAKASGNVFYDDFAGDSLSSGWLVETHGSGGAYSLSKSILTLSTFEADPVASITVYQGFTPSGDSFILSARVRSQELRGFAMRLHAGSLPIFGSTAGAQLEFDTVDNSFLASREPSGGGWIWNTFYNPSVTGVWFVLEMKVNRNPMTITYNVYSDSGSVLGSFTATNLGFDYSDISYICLEAWTGPLAYDVDWIKTGPQDDGFESGTFNAWSGTHTTTGETASISSERAHHGTYSAQFTSNGGGGYEYAYCNESLTSSELYARGYFYVSQSGIVDDNDRVFFIVFRAGTNGLAYAGWKRTGDTTRWCLTMRDGTNYIDAFSSNAPSTAQWYSVELFWREDPIYGVAELWVNGYMVCSSFGKDTTVYGDVSTVQVGIAEIYNCASSTVYSDCVRISNSPVEEESGASIYILSDGSIDPLTAPLVRIGNTYTLTDSLICSVSGIVVERTSIVLDGAGHYIQGNSAMYSTGIQLNNVENVTITNFEISAFSDGVRFVNSSRNRIYSCVITNNSFQGIVFGGLEDAWNYNNITGNIIDDNIITRNAHGAIGALAKAVNCEITNNQITDNSAGIISGDDLSGG